MTDKPAKPTKEEILANPERYHIVPGGVVEDRETGRVVGRVGGKHLITKETSQLMHARRRELGLRSHLRGMILGAGLDIDPDDVDDDMVRKAGDALELYVAHMGRTFLKSQNIRGMGEIFPKLVEPFSRVMQKDDEDDASIPVSSMRGLLRDIANAARAISETQK